MRFSYYINPQPDDSDARNFIAELLDQVVLAEQLGYSDVWLTEHHFTGYNVYSDPILLAAAISQKAPSMNIGFSVNVAPFHHPVRFATQINLLDQLTNGKVIIGIGPGNSVDEYTGYGLDIENRHEMMAEFMKVVFQAWDAKSEFSYSGKYYNGKVSGRIIPSSVQKPYPRIAIASTTPERLEWIGANGWSILLGPQNPEIVASRIKYYFDGMRKAKLSEIAKLNAWQNTGVLRQIYIADKGEDWKNTLSKEINNYIQRSAMANTGVDDLPKEQFEVRKQAYLEGGWLLGGTPEEVFNKLKPFAEMGLSNLMCWFNFGGMQNESIKKSMEKFQKYVAPELKKIKIEKGLIKKITTKKIILNSGLQNIP
ncbi:MAG: LLM class flavin-dependent oxidoreductase [Dehalococcoidia bacterium]|nr:LLM class flavin-dependent oxidoreductase [Dehalococcoidia bacterium]